MTCRNCGHSSVVKCVCGFDLYDNGLRGHIHDHQSTVTCPKCNKSFYITSILFCLERDFELTQDFVRNC
jgi:hypothetical protein